MGVEQSFPRGAQVTAVDVLLSSASVGSYLTSAEASRPVVVNQTLQQARITLNLDSWPMEEQDWAQIPALVINVVRRLAPGSLREMSSSDSQRSLRGLEVVQKYSFNSQNKKFPLEREVLRARVTFASELSLVRALIQEAQRSPSSTFVVPINNNRSMDVRLSFNFNGNDSFVDMPPSQPEPLQGGREGPRKSQNIVSSLLSNASPILGMVPALSSALKPSSGTQKSENSVQSMMNLLSLTNDIPQLVKTVIRGLKSSDKK